jgi:hypothetical protein
VFTEEKFDETGARLQRVLENSLDALHGIRGFKVSALLFPKRDLE